MANGQYISSGTKCFCWLQLHLMMVGYDNVGSCGRFLSSTQ